MKSFSLFVEQTMTAQQRIAASRQQTQQRQAERLQQSKERLQLKRQEAAERLRANQGTSTTKKTRSG